MRLQKYLAQCGVASRRKSEEYILEGRVAVNGVVVQTLGTQVSEEDEVVCDGRVVRLSAKHVYYILNKPVGYVTTVKDERDRPTVLDIMQEVEERIFPVGRLDYNTSGLLILTNDGELTYALTHPKHEVEKTYEAKVSGKITERERRRLETGVVIEGKKTAPAHAKLLKENENNTHLLLTIHEGRNRQVRKMCEAIGHSIIKLKRVSIGEITLNKLQVGEYRKLTEKEVAYLKKVGGLDA